MKLIQYATDDVEINKEMDKAVKRYLPMGSNIAFLPSAPESKPEYFEYFKKWYGTNGYKNVKAYDLANLDIDINPALVNEFLSNDAIYLSGGNTFNFLHYLVQKGLLIKLQEYARKGGILIGISAGAMLMGSNIRLTSLYSETHDTYQVGNMPSLNLTNYDFVPHWNTESHFVKSFEKIETILKKRTVKTKKSIYAIPEGSGIITWDGNPIFIGKYSLFAEGVKYF